MVGEGYDAFWSASRWGIWPSKMPTYRGTWVKIFKKVKCPGVYPFTGGERWFWIRHFHISHNAPYLPLPPPEKRLCISIVFNLSWDIRNNQEKWKTKVMEHLGGGEQIMCIMENVKVAYWLEHKCNVLIFCTEIPRCSRRCQTHPRTWRFKSCETSQQFFWLRGVLNHPKPQTSKTRAKRRTFHETNQSLWVKFMKSSTSGSVKFV